MILLKCIVLLIYDTARNNPHSEPGVVGTSLGMAKESKQTHKTTAQNAYGTSLSQEIPSVPENSQKDSIRTGEIVLLNIEEGGI